MKVLLLLAAGFAYATADDACSNFCSCVDALNIPKDLAPTFRRIENAAESCSHTNPIAQGGNKYHRCMEGKFHDMCPCAKAGYEKYYEGVARKKRFADLAPAAALEPAFRQVKKCMEAKLDDIPETEWERMEPVGEGIGKCVMKMGKATLSKFEAQHAVCRPIAGISIEDLKKAGRQWKKMEQMWEDKIFEN